MKAKIIIDSTYQLEKQTSVSSINSTIPVEADNKLTKETKAARRVSFELLRNQVYVNDMEFSAEDCHALWYSPADKNTFKLVFDAAWKDSEKCIVCPLRTLGQRNYENSTVVSKMPRLMKKWVTLWRVQRTSQFQCHRVAWKSTRKNAAKKTVPNPEL